VKEDESIELEVSLSKSEIARYNFYHIRWLLLIDSLGFIGLIAMALASVFNHSQEVRDILSSLLIWAILLLAAGLSQPAILIAQIYVFKNPAMKIQTARRNYFFAMDGIHIRLEGKSALTPWERILKVRDIGQMILIYTGRKLAYPIPKRCFGSMAEISRFSEFIYARIGAAKK